jgi:hypothetical protein
VASDDTEEGSKLNTKTHDKEGEGEEDEETTHVVKAKVYKLAKVDTKWTDMGVGQSIPSYLQVLLLTATKILQACCG